MPILTPLTLLLLCLLAAGCRGGLEREAAELTGGDPDRGRELVRLYGCHTCHTIPGVRGADALVGPPLTSMGSRVYVAGRLPNTPENLMHWIRNPQEVSPGTAMPDTGVTPEHVRDITAYLYTLR